jgi:class 3 adenylate cyclase/CHASE2 domain-containing sensor protein
VERGAWNTRNWTQLSGLITLLLVAICALLGAASTYESIFPALGGPNGLLYDATLRISQSWRRDIRTAPVIFVAIDKTSLSSPELAALPRALFQPVWARLIDGLFDAGARSVAFDLVFAYAGADFRVDSFKLPEYDRSLVDSLAKNRERIVLGRFPDIPPAPPFINAVGTSRVAVLDLSPESDGRIRSTAALVQLPNSRIAFGFAALGAGLSVRDASSTQRILIVPHAPLIDTPTYALGTLLSCLSSAESVRRVREAIEGRIVVVGTAVPGEDERRGPTRFLGLGSRTHSDDRCAPQTGLVVTPEPDIVPGALLQIAAIQSAASDRPVRLAPEWLRLIAGGALALLFAVIAFRDESALTIAQRGVLPNSLILMQVGRSLATGLLGPAMAGTLITAAALIWGDLWLPMGYPIVGTILGFGAIVGIRSIRHRIFFSRLYRTAGRYVPPERLVALARSGFADLSKGEERVVSILLADFVGFTSFANKPDRTASEVVQVANEYFTLMQSVIDHHGGCSDRFLGDAVLAFWNGLSDEPHHALKALITAKGILDAVSHFGRSGEHRVAARVVVCSGRVYVGDLGAKQRSSFTIVGPAANETFRLEKVADDYGLSLLVAASTAEMIMASESISASRERLGGNVLVRVDNVTLKGFPDRRSFYTLVPGDDPGLTMFETGRKALDQGRLCEGLSSLKAVDRGMLQQAAKTVADRINVLQQPQTA